MRTRSLVAALLTLAVVGIAQSPTAEAQSIAAGLSSLLTEQTPAPPGYVRDLPAAEATFQTVAGLFKVELTSLPLV